MYMGTSLEQHRLVTRPFAKRKCANGLGRFIVEAVEHLVQILDA
jgi:hypothetical protein